jgi:very-short-patch-repair endonuclease
MAKRGIPFARQVPIWTRGGSFTVDFLVGKRCVVECEGRVHAAMVERDNLREELIKEQGFEVLRFANFEVFDNIAGVLEKVCARLKIIGPIGVPV